MRSGLYPARRTGRGMGIISACAERSGLEYDVCTVPRDHLRVCGAVGSMGQLVPHPMGSSPRVRRGR